MELGFATKGLRRTCEQGAWARRELGADAASGLQRRLADLESVDAITELPWLTVEFGTHDDAAIEFHPGFWLTIMPIRGGDDMDHNRAVRHPMIVTRIDNCLQGVVDLKPVPLGKKIKVPLSNLLELILKRGRAHVDDARALGAFVVVVTPRRAVLIHSKLAIRLGGAEAHGRQAASRECHRLAKVPADEDG